MINETNMKFAAEMLLRDPETKEELCPCGAPKDNGDGSFSFEVVKREGARKYKHTIRTEEAGDTVSGGTVR